MTFRRFVVLTWFLCAHALAAQGRSRGGSPAPLSPPAGLDALVGRVLQTFQVPGASIAIVKDGRVVLAKGYGVRKLGDSATVDEHTLFGIASNTKLFTATALGLLVEQGKLQWDAPVINYLPTFAMYDPFVTRELTVRDLLVHRSGLGLGAGDLLWWPASTYDRKEIVRRLRFIKPATSFRSAYAYDNVLYSVAGELIEAVTGVSWESFVQSQVLEKDGMRESNVRHSDAGHGSNVAAPHAPVSGAVRPIAAFTSDNVNPAGGINTNAVDIAKWMMVQLDSGRLADGSRLFTPRTTRQLWQQVTPLPVGVPPQELLPARAQMAGYALGVNVRDYRGRKMLTHTGGLPGFVSRVATIPDERLGVAVLTNQESTEAFDVIVNMVIDHYLGAPPYDWLTAYDAVAKRGAASVAQAESEGESRRNAVSKPSLALDRYAGTYQDDWYGDVVIERQAGKLVMRFSHSAQLVGELEHYQYDTFIVRWRDRELRADAYVTFALNAAGAVESARMEAVSPATDFSFDFQDLLLRRQP